MLLDKTGITKLKKEMADVNHFNRWWCKHAVKLALTISF